MNRQIKPSRIKSLEKFSKISKLGLLFFTYFIIIMPTLKTPPQRTRPANKPTPQKQAHTPTVRKTAQEKWDDLLQTPASEAFLTMMVAEVRAEREAGKLIDGDWE
jgi:hypothetical protein